VISFPGDIRAELQQGERVISASVSYLAGSALLLRLMEEREDGEVAS